LRRRERCCNNSDILRRAETTVQIARETKELLLSRKRIAFLANLGIIAFGLYHIAYYDWSQTSPAVSYSAICPPPIESSGASCYYIPMHMNHDGTLTLDNLTSLIKTGTNLTLFKEDYKGSTWYFTLIEGIPNAYYFQNNSAHNFNIITNRTIINQNFGYNPSGTYYLLIFGGFPNGFQDAGDIGFTLRYTVGISWNLLAIDFVVLIFLPSVLLLSSDTTLEALKRG
jgi:hypothetical protein